MIRSRAFAFVFALTFFFAGCGPQKPKAVEQAEVTREEQVLRIEHDDAAGTISVSGRGGRRRSSPSTPRRSSALSAPDRRARRTGVLTEYSPGAPHASDRPVLGLHAAQRPRLLPQPRRATTGGACRSTVLDAEGEEVRWQTVYDLLDEAGSAVLTETQRWAMREQNGALRARPRMARRGARPTSPSASTTTAGCSCGCRGAKASRARWSTPRGSATSAPRGSAPCGSTSACRSRAATTSPTSPSSIIPTTPAIRSPGASTDSSASAPARSRDGRLDDRRRRDRSHPASLVVYTGALNDVALTNAWTDLQRQRSTRRRCCGRSRSAKDATPNS